jgi:hypothetical protein
MEHTPDPEQDAADPVSKDMLGDASGRCGTALLWSFRVLEYWM